MLRYISILCSLALCASTLDAQTRPGACIDFVYDDHGTVVALADTCRGDTIHVAGSASRGPWVFRGASGIDVSIAPSADSLVYDTLVTPARWIVFEGDSVHVPADTSVTARMVRGPDTIVFSSSGGGPAISDTLDEVSTAGPRRIAVALVSSGTDGQVLTSAAGSSVWASDPGLPQTLAQFAYWTSITHNNPSDTSGGKHIWWLSQVARMWPVPHGSGYSALRANFFLLANDRYEVYGATMTTVGPGATAIEQTDRLVMRFFPAIAQADKQVRLYRIPAGYRVDGLGSTAPAVYGEHIGTWSIPAALWSSAASSTTLSVTLTLKVK